MLCQVNARQIPFAAQVTACNIPHVLCLFLLCLLTCCRGSRSTQASYSWFPASYLLFLPTIITGLVHKKSVVVVSGLLCFHSICSLSPSVSPSVARCCTFSSSCSFSSPFDHEFRCLSHSPLCVLRSSLSPSLFHFLAFFWPLGTL